MSDKQGLPKLHTTEKGVPVYDAGASRKANQLAREWAQVPRAGRGGEYIPSRELNDPGPNRTRITAAQQQHGRPDQLGMRMAMDRQGKIAPNQYAHHPDLHSAKSGDPPHHEFPHYHATNAKGEKVIYVYRNGGGGGRGGGSGGGGDGGGGGGRGGGGGGGGRGRGDGGTVLSAIANGVVGSRAGEKAQVQASGPGGIKFTTELDINCEQQLGKLVGLVVDPESGFLSLLTSAPQASKDLLGITMSDLALALLLVRSGDPSFSLDPADPSNPAGPKLRKVYIPEKLRSTTFGDIMFEADWKLKLLAFGSLSSTSVRSEADITFAQPEGATKHRYSRLWIENARVELAQSEAGVLVIKDVRMVVLAKRQVPDAASPSGLRDVDEHDATSSERIFAEEFTRRYDEVAAQYPCFQRLTELSKALSLAKFILTQTAIDLDWALIEQVASGCITEVSPNTVPTHRQSHSRTFPTFNGSYTRTLNLTGGVNLRVKVVQDSNDRQVAQSAAVHNVIKESSRGGRATLPLRTFYKGGALQGDSSAMVVVRQLPFCKSAYLAKAQRLLDAGDACGALAVLKAESNRKPLADEYVRARCIESWCHLKLNDIASLRTSIDEAKTPLRYTQSTDASLRLLDALDTELKKRAALGAARTHLQKAANLTAASAKRTYWLLALSELSSAIALQPTCECLLTRAEVNLELGKNQEALEDATQAFSRDPSSSQAAFLLGRSHRLLGSFYEAIDAFAAAERLSAQGQQKARAKEAAEAAHLELAKKVQTEVAGSGQQQYLLGNLAFSVPSSWTPDECPLMKAFRSSSKVMTPSVLVQQTEDEVIHGIEHLMDYVKSEFRPETTIAFPDYRFLDLDQCMAGSRGDLGLVTSRFRFSLEGHTIDVRTAWLVLGTTLYTLTLSIDSRFGDAGSELWTALLASLVADSLL